MCNLTTNCGGNYNGYCIHNVCNCIPFRYESDGTPSQDIQAISRTCENTIYDIIPSKWVLMNILTIIFYIPLILFISKSIYKHRKKTMSINKLSMILLFTHSLITLLHFSIDPHGSYNIILPSLINILNSIANITVISSIILLFLTWKKLMSNSLRSISKSSKKIINYISLFTGFYIITSAVLSFIFQHKYIIYYNVIYLIILTILNIYIIITIIKVFKKTQKNKSKNTVNIKSDIDKIFKLFKITIYQLFVFINALIALILYSTIKKNNLNATEYLIINFLTNIVYFYILFILVYFLSNKAKNNNENDTLTDRFSNQLSKRFSTRVIMVTHDKQITINYMK